VLEVPLISNSNLILSSNSRSLINNSHNSLILTNNSLTLILSSRRIPTSLHILLPQEIKQREFPLTLTNPLRIRPIPPWRHLLLTSLPLRRLKGNSNSLLTTRSLANKCVQHKSERKI